MKSIRKSSRRTKWVAAGAALAMAVGGGAAWAFFTSGGAGAGTASTADTVALKVNQTSTITGLTPGGPEQTLSGTYDNPNTSIVHVDGLWATIGTNNKVGCDITLMGSTGTAPL